jgi:4-hydroxy 2-oxovalerate aldolase
VTAPWITYRPELKVLDCTVRDGGLINDHKFDDAFVRAVYQACVEAGIDYMEVGYKSSKKIATRDQFGAWKFCDEDDLRRVVGDNPTPLKLTVMADAGKCDWHTDILPKSHSVLDMIRVAFAPRDSTPAACRCQLEVISRTSCPLARNPSTTFSRAYSAPPSAGG